MVERPDPRKVRVIATWDGVRYSYRAIEEGASPRAEPGAPTGPFPLIEASRAGAFARSGSSPSPVPTVLSTPAAAPPASRPPGLYDLPSLLARIWSVPAAQMANRGAFAVRSPAAPTDRSPRAPALEPAPADREEVPPFTVAEWTMPINREDPSLPLAAVPSLSFTPSVPIGAVSPPAPVRDTSVPTYHPATQYIAWRHPPCHLAYALPLSSERACSRGATLADGGRESGEPMSGWARRNMWMRLAVPAGSVGRYALATVATD